MGRAFVDVSSKWSRRRSGSRSGSEIGSYYDVGMTLKFHFDIRASINDNVSKCCARTVFLPPAIDGTATGTELAYYSCFIGHGSFFNALEATRLAKHINDAIKVTKIDTNHARLPAQKGGRPILGGRATGGCSVVL